MTYPIPYAKYQEHLKQGRFIGLKCTSCGATSFPPMAVCWQCAGSQFEEIFIKGEGTIRTFTVIRVAPEGREPPYVIAMVELDEGPYVMGNLDGVSPDNADMGLIGKRVRMGTRPVQGDIYSVGDTLVPAFTLL